ncbi:hemagglutinin repeat-containing protein [Achromobacter sp. AONIH1]|uniref:hemagglutinin repeat-containing protein n=2 Tax=unclassified Achromobacter TaxID=2626865 RepID=UPI00131A284E|nr:hemagglutinin repeat-containing protein [Achromobacter sp. AONIH1]
MSKFRSAIVWLVLYTQIWTPVLAQTLPISVDKNAAGQRPFVGTSNGVPVVNIAPPSAGGVSNNKFTEFNVGPSGVVLNNSGGASQTQLAGQVAGNPMLGNQRAATILNQVTAPNPSQLMGTMEVAGNRANIIVANPAGITCNGCGFLNADRATLTTGKPMVGPDGGIGFDVAGGKLRVEGAGLNGANLSRVDLMARTLEINAGIWADQLHVTAGAAKVDYATGAVSAGQGEGPAPTVALDTAALGGMYANSIRLVGTEAGVGVNVGGNLVALTGHLEVSAAGDVRITPSGTMQAARDVRVAAGRDVAVEGRAQGAGAVTLTAGRDAAVTGAVSAGQALTVDAAGDVSVSARGSLQTQDALRVAAGRDLALGGSLVMGDQDVRVQAGRNLRAGTVADSGSGNGNGAGNGNTGGTGNNNGGTSGNTGSNGSGNNGGNTGSTGGTAGNGAGTSNGSGAGASTETAASTQSVGLVSAKGALTLQAGRDIQLPGQISAARTLQAEAGGELSTTASARLQSGQAMGIRAGEGVTLAGSALSDTSLSIDAARELRLDGSALAYGGTLRLAGNDVLLGATSKTQGRGIDITATRDLRASGSSVSAGAAQLKAGRDAALAGTLAADGDLRLQAGGAATNDGQLSSTGKLQLQAGGDATLKGSLRSNGDLTADAGGKLALLGNASATTGALNLTSVGDLSIGKDATAQAGGAIGLRTQGNVTTAGALASLQALTISAAGDAAIDGKLLAGGPLSVDAIGKIAAGADAKLQAKGALRLDAGKALTLAGLAETNAGMTLASGTDLRVDGSAMAYGGALSLTAGQGLTLGANSTLQASGLLQAQAGGKLQADGTISGEQDIRLSSNADTVVNGKTVANGLLNIKAGTDLVVGKNGLAQGSGNLFLFAGQDLRIAGTAGTAETAATGGGTLRAEAGRDIFVTGTVTASSPASLSAQRHMSVDGTVTALSGDLTTQAGGDLKVAASGRLQSSGKLDAKAGGDIDSDGTLAAGGALALAATGDARLGGTIAALGTSAQGTPPAPGGRSLSVPASGDLSISGGRDLTIKQGAQVQAAGALNASAGRDLSVSGALASVRDLTLAAARDARVDGSAASDARLTLNGRNITVADKGLVQAADTLTATAAGSMQIAGRALAGRDQTLSAGDGLSIDGTAAALKGDLTLTATRGDLILGAASRQQADGTLTATAGGALQALGSASAGKDLSLRAGADARLGGVIATQTSKLSASAARDLFITTDGRLQSGAALALDAGGTLNNAGVAFASGRADLYAGTTLANTGSVLAGGDLQARTPGLLNNAGRFVAGVDADGKLSQPGSLTLTAGTLQHAGTSLAGKNMTLSATGMNLAGGTLSSVGLMTVAATQDIDASRATLHGGGLDLSAANLRNPGGKLTSSGDAIIKLGGELDNTGGTIAAAGKARIDAASLVNRDGTVAGGNLTITTSGAIDNQRGLLQADDTLTLTASSLDNSNTLTASNAPAKGVLGKVVSIVAGRVNNQGGAISAGQDLGIKTGELDNAAGEAASQGVARIEADTLKNTQGKLLAGKNLTVIVKALQGLGALRAGEDLSFEYAGSLNQEGEITAGRDLNLSVGGTLDNRARITAGRDLGVKAGTLNNQATGELVAGRNNTINVTGTLTNAGLIDGVNTRITAGAVTNLGRIYGDNLAIGTGSLVNSAGANGGAVIASRGSLDLGATTLVNEKHALIYSAADLRIGGALDANGRAVGQAVSLQNAAATIEAAGNANISAAAILNLNTNYTSEIVQVWSGNKMYVALNDTTMFDMATNWIGDQTTNLTSQDPGWTGNDAERRFLLPSDTYPASRYGPPFDYAPFKRDDTTKHAPITPIEIPRMTVCEYGENGYGCGPERRPGDGEPVFGYGPTFHDYGIVARIWEVFGVTPPAGPPPVWDPKGNRDEYERAFAAYRVPFTELNARIMAFNADFQSRLVGNFTYYKVTESISETRTLTSDPGKILSGGAMSLTGAVTNDKSQIAAGGTLSVAGPEINNIGAGGTRTITRVGQQTYTVETRSHRGGKIRESSTTDYNRTLAGQPIEVPVGTSGGGQQVTLSGTTPGGSAVKGVGPVLVASVGLPGGNAVRTVSNPASIPDSQLFAVNSRPDAPYIVNTDPRFTGQRPYVSSDYLFDLLRPSGGMPGGPTSNSVGAGGTLAGSRLGGWDALIPPGAKFLTPSGQPKRLGDGFYEQKAVSDQILATTGQRFLEKYSDNDSQYKALLAAGAKFAQDNGIKLGVALTEAQQRQLKTDLVWLVEQTVTLPDGSTETVLVPQVYLLVREGDLKGDGTLLAGRDVKIATEGNVTNSGTVGSREATVITAGNIVNQAGGTIQGGSVNLAARDDLTNLVSLIKGDKVALSAGRDITLTSTSDSERFSKTWGSFITGTARVEADSLNMQAGRDLTMTAAQVSVKNDARLQAGRDIALTSLVESHGQTNVRDSKNRHDLATSKEIGTTINAGGNLTLVAGQDVNARAADVTAGKQLAVGAGRDINITAGVATGYTREEIFYTVRGFLSKKSTHTIQSRDWAQAQGSTFTGDTAVLMAGRDLNVSGSNVAAQKDLVLSGGHDVNIVSGENTLDRYDYTRVKKSGFGALGGFSFGSRTQTDSLEGKKVFHTASTVGSVEGDTLIKAGNALNVMGSNVLARQGDVTLIGQQVNIGATSDTSREREYHEVKQSGFSVTASNPVVSAVQTGERMANAASKVDNPVMLGLAGATTGLAAMNAYDAVKKAGSIDKANAIDKAGGVSVLVSFGTSKSSSTTERSSTSAFGSSVAAGKDLTIVAQGAGRDSDITVTGSSLSAGRNAVLKADGDILLQAARNAFEQKTDSKSSSASIGLGFSLGAQSGVTLELGVSASRGKADGKDESWTNSHVVAGNTLAFQSGGDTTLKGASGKADQIIASVGGNLLLESLQDTSKYNSKNQSAGIGASICLSGTCTSSISGNAGAGKMQSDFRSVTEQTGLWSGDGGFLIDVKNNTTLIGSVIASSDKAVADGLNKLSTGTLVTEDVKNKASYSGYQVSVGGSMGIGGGQGTGAGTTKDNKVAGGATKEVGTSLPSSGNVSMNMPTVAGASGSSSSTTSSAISGGTIVIRDEAGQQALTGKTAAETIASLNRDTSDTLNALKPIFDKEKIEAGFEIVSESNRQVGQFLTNRAKEIESLEVQSKNPKLSQQERDDAAASAIRLRRDWGPTGTYRQALVAISAGASGNVMGGVGQFAQAAAVNYLQALTTERVKKLADSFGDGPEAEAVRAGLHAIVGCAGAAVNGSGACGSGALGASTSSILNALLTRASSDSLRAEDKETYNSLIASLVGAVGLGVGADVVSVIVAARTETENNYLKASEAKEMMDELLLCRVANNTAACRAEVLDKYETISEGRSGGRISACKLAGESNCHIQRSSVQGGTNALELMEGLGWSKDEYVVLDRLLAINLNDERVAHHAWLQAFYQEAGAPIPIGVGIVVGGAIRAEASVAKSEALAGRRKPDPDLLKGSGGKSGEYLENFSPSPTPLELVQGGSPAYTTNIRLDHILDGGVNVLANGTKKGTGGHYLRSPTVRVDRMTGAADAAGVTKGYVSIRDPVNGKWVEKQAETTFFPSSWSKRQTQLEIEGAFLNSKSVQGSLDKWRGTSPSGVVMEGYYGKPDGSAATAWPVYNGGKR